MSKQLELQEQELRYLQDTEFLRAKLRIQDTLRALLEQAQQQIAVHKDSLQLPLSVWEVPPKISRGENYEGLPYLVLDYPRIFQQEATFAYRCMLWWGHGFSCTLHLGGAYWQQHQEQLLQGLKALPQPNNWWVGVNSTPWEYHYRPDNYLPLQVLSNTEGIQGFKEKPFFKISRHLPINRYQELPQFCMDTLQELSDLLKE